jgi:ABC-type transporter MlaC component
MSIIKNILFFLCLSFLFDAYAGDNNKDIEIFIGNFSERFEAIGKITDNRKKEESLLKLANEIADIDWMSNFILGKHRREFSEEKKKDFIDNYSKSLVRNYISVLDVYKKNNYRIVSIDKQKEEIFNVATVVNMDGKEIKNNFRIIKKGNSYFITDIIVEGVSFITAQRAEINSIISSGNFDKFLKDLKLKNGNK